MNCTYKDGHGVQCPRPVLAGYEYEWCREHIEAEGLSLLSAGTNKAELRQRLRVYDDGCSIYVLVHGQYYPVLDTPEFLEHPNDSMGLVLSVGAPPAQAPPPAAQHPSSLPRLRLVFAPSEPAPEPAPDSLEVPWTTFLVEPTEISQWVNACLLRMYVISTAPLTPLDPVAPLPQGSVVADGQAIRLTWKEPPKHFDALRSLAAGFGHPEPEWIFLATQGPKETFLSIRSMGLDELSGYVCTNARKLPELLKLLKLGANAPHLLTDTDHGRVELESMGLSMSQPPPRELLPRVPGSLSLDQIPPILRPVMGGVLDDVTKIAAWLDRQGHSVLAHEVRRGVWR